MASNDVLSNEEVDAIMDTVADQSEETSDFASYFGSGERTAQNQLQGLSVANERLKQEFQLSLEKKFGVRIDISMHAPEVLKLEDCIAELPEDAILNLIRLNISEEKSLLAMDETLLTGFINRYFGSQLAQAGHSRAEKKLNTTESRINDRVVGLFGAALTRSWQEIAMIEFSKQATEINPDFIRLGRHEDTLVRFVLDISFGEFSGAMTWLLYYDAVEALLNRREQDAGAASTAKATDWREQIFSYIQDVSLDVHVRLPDFSMTLGQVRELEVGSLLPLANPAEARLYIEGTPMFFAEYGSYEGNKAVSLTQRIDLAANQ